MRWKRQGQSMRSSSCHQESRQESDETDPAGRKREASGAGEGWSLEREPLAKISVAALLAADSPRVEGESSEHVRTLAESDGDLPPIVVHRPTMRVIDGMHRLRAAVMLGQDEVAVRFFDGSAEDAFVLAVELNAKHGMPLTSADRAAAVVRIIRSHPDWSNRLIASIVGVSDKTVAAVRRRSAAELPQSNTRVGRDGRTRRVDGAEARRRAGLVVVARPEASLREIAAEAGVSISTARDVRLTVLSEREPTPPRQQPAAGSREPLAEARMPSGPGNGRHSAETVSVELEKVLQSLRADPSLRLTEAGRAILRLLALHSRYTKDWGQLVENLPSHQMAILAKIARGCGESWLHFAQQLERRDPGRDLGGRASSATDDS